MSQEQQSAVQKYRTLARAVAANDAPACYEIYEVLKEQGKELSDDDVNALGMRWLTNRDGQSIEVARFLGELGFDFNQTIILDPENENTGTRIPFRMFGDEDNEKTLLELIDAGLVPLDITDGMGDNLIVAALENERFSVADDLLARGVDINNTNLAGQSALHVFAGHLNYQAVQWLGENGADPTIEDLQGSRPSEMVPEEMQGWDAECMFEVLEDYVLKFRSGQRFEINPQFNEMIDREKGDEDDQTLGEQADEAKALMASLGMK